MTLFLHVCVKCIGLDTMIVSEIKTGKASVTFFSFTVNLENTHTHIRTHARTYKCTKKGMIREKGG